MLCHRPGQQAVQTACGHKLPRAPSCWGSRGVCCPRQRRQLPADAHHSRHARLRRRRRPGLRQQRRPLCQPVLPSQPAGRPGQQYRSCTVPLPGQCHQLLASGVRCCRASLRGAMPPRVQYAGSSSGAMLGAASGAALQSAALTEHCPQQGCSGWRSVYPAASLAAKQQAPPEHPAEFHFQPRPRHQCSSKHSRPRRWSRRTRAS
jgi:hypothetical protein